MVNRSCNTFSSAISKLNKMVHRTGSDTDRISHQFRIQSQMIKSMAGL